VTSSRPDHAEQRRLATPALAHEHDESAVLEARIDTGEHHGLAETLAERA
jgi:hypothetical protein